VIFTESKLKGAFIVDLERREDQRGFFARTFCRREFEARGLRSEIAQANASVNNRKGTLRGLHLQVPPSREAKLIHCTRGRIYDVVVDLRKGSPSYKEWFGVELSENNYRQLYVPAGCGHGYLTLADDTAVQYLVTDFYAPELESGVRWNDPAFGIEWPMQPDLSLMKERDRTWPDYED